MALRPQLHHRSVILGADLLRCRRVAAPRWPPSVCLVGIVLVGRLRRQDPHPRRQLRLHVEDPLARRHELLGSRPHPQLANALFNSVCTATAVCDPLCGSTPIITAITAPPSSRGRTACLIAALLPTLTPLSSQTTARPRTAGTSFGSQDREDPQTAQELRRRGLSTLGATHSVVVDTQSDGSGAASGCSSASRHLRSRSRHQRSERDRQGCAVRRRGCGRVHRPAGSGVMFVSRCFPGHAERRGRSPSSRQLTELEGVSSTGNLARSLPRGAGAPFRSRRTRSRLGPARSPLRR